MRPLADAATSYVEPGMSAAGSTVFSFTPRVKPGDRLALVAPPTRMVAGAPQQLGPEEILEAIDKNDPAALTWTLADRAGTVFASGTAMGTGKTKGRWRNPVNCEEVLADALQQAAATAAAFTAPKPGTRMARLGSATWSTSDRDNRARSPVCRVRPRRWGWP